MATDEKAITAAGITGANRAGEAMLRRHGIVNPAKVSEEEVEKLRKLGIDANTYERKALTWAGAIQEFGKPLGPRLYNEVHVAGFGPVPPGRNDINLMSLEDKWMSPRKDEETDEEFEARKKKFVARRERVHQLIAAAEQEVAKGVK
jgi:hypothetical protein